MSDTLILLYMSLTLGTKQKWLSKNLNKETKEYLKGIQNANAGLTDSESIAKQILKNTTQSLYIETELSSIWIEYETYNFFQKIFILIQVNPYTRIVF